MGFLYSDKQFNKTLLHIAIPIALQNLVASALNMVDTIMIGQLGETEIAAVGLANQPFFLFILFLFGVSSGAAIFTSQFWGSRDIKNIRRILGIALITSILVAVVFMLVALFLPRQVMGIFTKDTSVINVGSEYLYIIGFSYIVTALTFCYASILRSVEQAKLPMVLSVIALGLNTIFNYFLIFGRFGFPMMGVRGAAIATVAARIIEAALMLTFIYWKKHVPAASIKEMLDLSMVFIRRFYRTSLPVILNESIWALGITGYAVVYGHIGEGAVAAVNIAGTVERLAMVLFFGMASASAVMIGNRIGANEEDKAYDYGRRFLVIGPILGIFMGILLMLLTPTVVSIFNVSQEVTLSAQRILIIFGFLMPVRIFNLINIIGVLRSGGDTKFSLFLDTAGVWGIGIPLGFIGGILLGLPIHWVVLLVSLEEVFKVTFGFKRFISKKWINNLVSHMDNTVDDVPAVLVDQLSS